MVLEGLNDENIGNLIDILEENSYLGRTYMSVPVFDKVNTQSFVSSVLGLSNKGRKALFGFFKKRYYLDLPININEGDSDYSVEIDNLTTIVTELSGQLTNYSGTDKASISKLIDYVTMAKERCEGYSNPYNV